MADPLDSVTGLAFDTDPRDVDKALFRAEFKTSPRWFANAAAVRTYDLSGRNRIMVGDYFYGLNTEDTSEDDGIDVIIDSGGNHWILIAAGLGLPQSATRSALAAIDGSITPAVYLREAAREGIFDWDSNDLSTAVTADPEQGIYVPPTSDATGASGAWVRQFDGPVLARWFGAVGGTVSEAVAEANEVAINAAIDFVGDFLGGGTVLLDDLFTVRLADSKYEDTAASADFWINAIKLPYDNTILKGEGPATGLKVYDTDGSYGVIQFMESPLENGEIKVFNSAIRNMLVDGNYTGTTDNNHHCIKPQGLQDCDLTDLVVKNSGQYLIGMQNGGFVRTLVERCVLDGSVADGIDLKNNENGDGDSTSYGVAFRHISVKNFGKGSDVSTYAGLDIMAKDAILDDILVEIGNDTGSTIGAGIRLKQGLDGDDIGRGNGAQRAILSNCRVVKLAGASSGTSGFDIRVPYVTLIAPRATGAFDYGIRWMQPYGDIIAPQIDGATTAINLQDISGSADSFISPLGASYTNVTGGLLQNFTTGIYCQQTNIFVQGATFLTGTSGIDGDLDNTVASFVIENNRFVSVTTPIVDVPDSAARAHRLLNNFGVRGPRFLARKGSGSDWDRFELHAYDRISDFLGYNGTASTQKEAWRVSGPADPSTIVNLLNAIASATGVALQLAAVGTDTNIDIKVVPKGAGLTDILQPAFRDSDASHRLKWALSNLTADRTFSLLTGDADRSITLSGSPTLSDWFDQSVKAAATPSFAQVTLGGDPTNAMDAATRQWVLAQIAALVDSSPGTLDTLNELAAALGDDANFATTVTNALALKAAKSQTEAIAVNIELPDDKTYPIALKLPYGLTITGVTSKCTSGTCTATVKIDGVALGGTANSVSSSESTQAHASSNVAAAGADLSVTISSNSSCLDLQLMIEATRTLS